MSKEELPKEQEPDYISALKAGVDGATIDVPEEVMAAIESSSGEPVSLEDLRARISKIHLNNPGSSEIDYDR